MGQLRTANKRHKRAIIRTTKSVEAAPVAQAKPATKKKAA